MKFKSADDKKIVKPVNLGIWETKIEKRGKD